MVWPFQYQRAEHDFERFMSAARDAADLETTNMAWSMVQGVLWAFRRRLTVPQVADFANLLPPLLRSLFIEGWDPAAPVATFASREALTREVRQVRPQHNFAPDHSIRAVAIALRASVDESKLEVLLSKLPPEARAFWWPGER